MAGNCVLMAAPACPCTACRVAYLGAACAGVPLSLIVKYYGWGAFFAALLTACAAAFLLLAPMVNAASWGQKQAKLA